MVSTLRTPGPADQQLIEEVRIHEVLYACPTKSNKDNQLRDTAWQEIADAVGKTGLLDDCFSTTAFQSSAAESTLSFFLFFFVCVSSFPSTCVQWRRPRRDGGTCETNTSRSWAGMTKTVRGEGEKKNNEGSACFNSICFCFVCVTQGRLPWTIRRIRFSVSCPSSTLTSSGKVRTIPTGKKTSPRKTRERRAKTKERRKKNNLWISSLWRLLSQCQALLSRLSTHHRLSFPSPLHTARHTLSCATS